jgi:hypothetical protein
MTFCYSLTPELRNDDSLCFLPYSAQWWFGTLLPVACKQQFLFFHLETIYFLTLPWQWAICSYYFHNLQRGMYYHFFCCAPGIGSVLLFVKGPGKRCLAWRDLLRSFLEKGKGDLLLFLPFVSRPSTLCKKGNIISSLLQYYVLHSMHWCKLIFMQTLINAH